MKLMPLFTLEDVLRLESGGNGEFSVPYLFDTDLDIAYVSEDIRESAEVRPASGDVAPDREVIDTAELPFGIGDVFSLSEPFRIYSWDAEQGAFMFQYKDGTVGMPVIINDEEEVRLLLGGSVLPRGTVGTGGEDAGAEVRRVTRWRPSHDMPREAMRVVKTVRSAEPVRISGLAACQLRSAGFDSAESFLENAKRYQPDAGPNNWTLLVGLSDPSIPSVDLMDAGSDMPVF